MLPKRALSLLTILSSLVLVTDGLALTSDDSPKGGKETVEHGDVNGDGKPDVWVYFQDFPVPGDAKKTQRRIVKRSADLNYDGKVDVTRTYNAQEIVVEETADLDFDGKLDTRAIYHAGRVKERHIYAPSSQKIWIKKFYKDGKVEMLERDDNADGVTDYCERWYVAEGIHERQEKGRDINGDGVCEDWKKSK